MLRIFIKIEKIERRQTKVGRYSTMRDIFKERKREW
jgi:hypothetical protein